jgi:hypothetical protein
MAPNRKVRLKFALIAAGSGALLLLPQFHVAFRKQSPVYAENTGSPNAENARTIHA